MQTMNDKQLAKFFEFAVGSKIIYSGYPGVIIKMHTGQLSGMADIRLASGDSCVDLAELDAPSTRFLVMAQQGYSWKEIGSYTTRVGAEDAARAYSGEYNLYVQVVEHDSPEHNALLATGHWPHKWTLQNDDLLVCACGARKVL